MIQWSGGGGLLAVVSPSSWDTEAAESFKSCLGLKDNVLYGQIDESSDLNDVVGKSEFVMAAGNDALAVFRPDLNVGRCHGRLMRFDDILVLPVFHVESYHRMPPWKIMLQQQFAQFRDVAAGRIDWGDSISETCVHCRKPAWRVDVNGVVYCSTC